MGWTIAFWPLPILFRSSYVSTEFYKFNWCGPSRVLAGQRFKGVPGTVSSRFERSALATEGQRPYGLPAVAVRCRPEKESKLQS